MNIFIFIIKQFFFEAEIGGRKKKDAKIDFYSMILFFL
jgi:hypothetical protein